MTSLRSMNNQKSYIVSNNIKKLDSHEYESSIQFNGLPFRVEIDDCFQLVSV